MTGPDFLDNFNLLYNNIMSNQAPGLDIEEIALFLTKAEQEIIKNYFNPKSNNKQEGYADSTKRMSDFITLTTTRVVPVYNNRYTIGDGNDIMFTISEECNDKPVILISPEEYNRVRLKPYPFPQKGLVWKVAMENNTYKLITPDDVSIIYITYIRAPKPFSYDFYNEDNPCELPEYMHSEVIQRAIELAKISWIGDLNATMSEGQRAE